MNLREGLRRVGLTLGVTGAAATALYAIEPFQKLVTQRTNHLRFESLVNSVLMRKMSRSIADQKFVDGEVEVGPNAIGISKVYVQSGKAIEFEFLDGNQLWRTDAPSFASYIMLLLAPVAGFMIPFALVRLLTWILSGFFP